MSPTRYSRLQALKTPSSTGVMVVFNLVSPPLHTLVPPTRWKTTTTQLLDKVFRTCSL